MGSRATRASALECTTLEEAYRRAIDDTGECAHDTLCVYVAYLAYSYAHISDMPKMVVDVLYAQWQQIDEDYIAHNMIEQAPPTREYMRGMFRKARDARNFLLSMCVR